MMTAAYARWRLEVVIVEGEGPAVPRETKQNPKEVVMMWTLRCYLSLGTIF